MSTLRNRTENALRNLAGGDPSALFAFERDQTIGEPMLWRETIAFERGKLQTCRRRRSAVDAGGAPIGVWSCPAEEWRAQAIAKELVDGQFWTLESSAELMPGQDLVHWSCLTAGGLFEIVVTSGSPLLRALAPLELELRRLANDLEASARGAAVQCSLELARGPVPRARLALTNPGDRPCVIWNPLAGNTTDFDFLRVEVANLPPAVEDESGPGLEFVPVPELPRTSDLPEPWDDPYLLLAPRQTLQIPIETIVPLLGRDPANPGKGSFLVRGVYSAYGSPEQVGGVPLLNGRAFSNEVQVDA